MRRCLKYSTKWKTWQCSLKKKKKESHLYFKVVVIKELLVHCLGVRVDGPQENSGRWEKSEHTYEQSTQRRSALSKNKYWRQAGGGRC